MRIPQYHELIWPVLRALNELGGSATVKVSFPVYFQCKRYKGTVTAGAVRDFRGAMSGRGEKGLLITTGSFTKDAQNEASRDGAPPVELIDGDHLCDLLREYRLGVEVRERIEEEIVLHADFFNEYDEESTD